MLFRSVYRDAAHIKRELHRLREEAPAKLSAPRREELGLNEWEMALKDAARLRNEESRTSYDVELSLADLERSGASWFGDRESAAHLLWQLRRMRTCSWTFCTGEYCSVLSRTSYQNPRFRSGVSTPSSPSWTSRSSTSSSLLKRSGLREEVYTRQLTLSLSRLLRSPFRVYCIACGKQRQASSQREQQLRHHSSRSSPLCWQR